MLFPQELLGFWDPRGRFLSRLSGKSSSSWWILTWGGFVHVGNTYLGVFILVAISTQFRAPETKKGLTYVFIDNENSYFFTLLYIGGKYTRLVYTWYKNIFHMIAVMIVFLAVIKYAHNRTTEGHERYRWKIHCLIPEVKADRCSHDSI